MRLPARAFVTVVWQTPRNCFGVSQYRVRKTKNFLVTQKAGYKNLFPLSGLLCKQCWTISGLFASVCPV